MVNRNVLSVIASTSLLLGCDSQPRFLNDIPIDPISGLYLVKPGERIPEEHMKEARYLHRQFIKDVEKSRKDYE